MENILPTAIIELITDAQKVFMEQGIDYFIVGAIARDIQLAKHLGLIPSRKTNDVDFAVVVPNESKFDDIKSALVATGKFKPDENNPLKLLYKKGIEIDLMPFGGIENEMREISLRHPKVFTMDVPGFIEAYNALQDVQLDDKHFRACSVEGLILLKLYAWNNRSSRTKDLQDIDLLLANYVDLSDNVYENHFDALNKYDEKLQTYLISVSGRVVGRELAKLLSYDNEKISVIHEIITKRPVIGWLEMADGLEDI